MKDTTLILLGAGNSTRFGLDVKKQWLYSDDVPLWLQVAQKFEALNLFDSIIIVSSPKEIAYMKEKNANAKKIPAEPRASRSLITFTEYPSTLSPN